MTDEAMTIDNPPSKSPSMTGGTVLLLALVLLGLGLFFWLAPRTPIVAAPAFEEAGVW